MTIIYLCLKIMSHMLKNPPINYVEYLATLLSTWANLSAFSMNDRIFG